MATCLELPVEQLLRAFLGGDRRAASGVAQGGIFVRDGEHERWVAGLVANFLGGELVEGNPVAEAAALRVRRASEEAALGDVADAELAQVLVITYFGALLSAGMGHMAYEQVPGIVGAAATRMLAGEA